MSLLLTDSGKPDLGIDKFPPEKAMYRSVLRETKLHQEVDGKWMLAKPPQGTSLLPAWEKVEEFFASTDDVARPFSDINAELIAAPYGVKAGLLPILWLSVYLVNQHELALYEERKYVPGFNRELLERFVKRPDQFSVQRFRIEGLNASIFDEYCEVISGGEQPKTILDIAKPLANFMGSLPDYTTKTRNGLSEKAISFRTAFNLSKSPEHLVFEGLPKALGYQNLRSKEVTIEGFSEDLKDVLRELGLAHPKLIEGLQSRLAEMLSLNANISLAKLRETSQERCAGLENYTLDAMGVRGLLVRINRQENDDALWFENILMFLGAKPSKKWTDADHDEAEYKLTQLSRRLTDLFNLAAEESSCNKLTDETFDVYLLKSLKKGSDFLDEVVSVDEAKKFQSRKLKERLEAVLNESCDSDLQLAALAQVVDNFLSAKRDHKKTNQETKKHINRDKTA